MLFQFGSFSGILSLEHRSKRSSDSWSHFLKSFTGENKDFDITKLQSKILTHILSVWTWRSYLISLNFHFLMCKIKIKSASGPSGGEMWSCPPSGQLSDWWQCSSPTPSLPVYWLPYLWACGLWPSCPSACSSSYEWREVVETWYMKLHGQPR